MCVNLVDCVSLKYNTPQVYVSSYVWLDLIGEDHRLGSSRTPVTFSVESTTPHAPGETVTVVCMMVFFVV